MSVGSVIAADPRKLLPDRVAENLTGHLGLLQSFGRNLGVQLGQQNPTCRRVVKPIEQLPRDSERGRNDAAGVPGVHAFGKNLDGQRASDQSTQRRRHPQLLIVAAAGIESHHQLHVTESRRQQFKIGRQIRASAFLAGLDDADAAWPRYTLGINCGNRRQRGVNRVAVVGATAAIEFAVLDDGLPWAEVVAPALHFRLLVEVPVEQHRAVVAESRRRRYVEQQAGRAAFDRDDLDRQAVDRLSATPVLGRLDHRVQVSVYGPTGVERGGFRGYANVVDQARDEVLVPFFRNEAV